MPEPLPAEPDLMSPWPGGGGGGEGIAGKAAKAGGLATPGSHQFAAASADCRARLSLPQAVLALLLCGGSAAARQLAVYMVRRGRNAAVAASDESNVTRLSPIGSACVAPAPKCALKVTLTSAAPVNTTLPWVSVVRKPSPTTCRFKALTRLTSKSSATAKKNRLLKVTMKIRGPRTVA